MNAEQTQVGGNHYKNMAYQTARFGFDAGLASLGTQIAKYLTRDKGSRLENLEKAYHCIALDQQFDKEYKADFTISEGKYLKNIYCEQIDEEYLSRYFSQFTDGDKLKLIMRLYMQAKYPQAKGLLRKYIKGLEKELFGDEIRVGVMVRRVDGRTFSNGTIAVTVDRVEDGKVHFKETGTWLYLHEVELV